MQAQYLEDLRSCWLFILSQVFINTILPLKHQIFQIVILHQCINVITVYMLHVYMFNCLLIVYKQPGYKSLIKPL